LLWRKLEPLGEPADLVVNCVRQCNTFHTPRVA
jgi:hypothetical protein